ncbi:hypothetical protein KP509_03G044100 [Ceratopteris richardii]|nr:hypothetical protein KP509_03G044100 [Ceratopteris richardii]KAH7441575.1 hypothetical protein KP509_03G044100 [Ceratopteris richardii]
MRPRSGGDVPHVRNCAFKSANSSRRSSITENDVEQLPSHRERCIVADAEIITSPREYLKSLNKSCDFREEKRMESSPVVSALSDELKRALDRVQELERFRTSARKEVDCLLKRFSDERALLRAREQEKIQAAVFAIEEELEKERKLRKKLELENKKLSRNLAEANKAVMKAEKELEKERKARQLMEDVCDELAREIGEDKAEVEALKRDHAREREEMDEERRTLQMTEAWREERVQMKLLDAKYELEERCVALDKLKLELELYLSSRQVAEGEAYSDDGQGDGLRAAAEKLKADVSWSMLFLENGNSIAPQSEDDPVSSDDIHSLRLSRDNTRCHEWGGPSDVRVKERAKWAINYAREEPNALITTDKAVGNDARNIARKAYSEYNGSLFMTKPWAQTVGTTSELLGRPSGIANHEKSEMEEDKEPIEGDVDDVATHDAGSQWRYTRQNGSDAVQDRHAQLAEEELGHIKASKADVKETETGRSKSRASSSPDSRNGLYKQVAPYQGEVLVHQNEGKHGFRKKHYEHARIESSRQKERDSKGVSPAAELSSLKQENDASAPSFMEQKVDWSDFPVYCNPLQGKRPTAAENAILHGRRDLAQWGKVSTSTQNLKTTPLLDDRGSRLQSRPKR